MGAAAVVADAAVAEVEEDAVAAAVDPSELLPGGRVTSQL